MGALARHPRMVQRYWPTRSCIGCNGSPTCVAHRGFGFQDIADAGLRRRRDGYSVAFHLRAAHYRGRRPAAAAARYIPNVNKSGRAVVAVRPEGIRLAPIILAHVYSAVVVDCFDIGHMTQ